MIGRTAGALLFLGAMLAGCDDGRLERFRERVTARLTTGEAAPAYAAPTLAGDTLVLAELRGHVVLLNVGATWCKACVDELPVLERLHRRYAASGLRLVGVSIDHAEPAELRAFLREHGVTYSNLRDQSWRLERTFGWGTGVPQSLLVDADGRIAGYWVGAVVPTHAAGEQALADTIEALLRSVSGPARH